MLPWTRLTARGSPVAWLHSMLRRPRAATHTARRIATGRGARGRGRRSACVAQAIKAAEIATARLTRNTPPSGA